MAHLLENDIIATFSYSFDSNVSETKSMTTSKSETVITTTIFICLGIIGSLGNAFVLFVFHSSKKLRESIVNIYLVNQSAIDLVSSVILIATSRGIKTSGWSSESITGKLCISIS